jgi:hypothetical protein
MVTMQDEVPVKITTFCHVYGDVVPECIHIGKNLDHEERMSCVMFNNSFVQSNVLVLNLDDIDVALSVNNRDFQAEVLNLHAFH